MTKSFTQEEISRNIIANALECVDTCKSYFGNYNPSHIFNTDQSGFNYEIHSGRSLAFIGTTSIEAQVQSFQAMTHSYTIQSTISIDGNLLTPLFICLQEEGEFGPQVIQRLLKPENVYVSCSFSGKMTKN